MTDHPSTKQPLMINIITIFPDMFPGCLGDGIIGQALNNDLWRLKTVNPRDFSQENYASVDDTPYGGGAGMVMRADLIADAVESLPAAGRLIYMSPRGRPLNQALSTELANIEEPLTILCGRYEGVDQRVLDAYGFEEISLGDFVLSGGEVAAQAMLESVIRLRPGVLGNAETLKEESFEKPLLEYPHYTRPAKWLDKQDKTWDVPTVLTSGHHAKIAQWRQEQAEKLTKEKRPDLWEKYLLQQKK